MIKKKTIYNYNIYLQSDPSERILKHFKLKSNTKINGEIKT